MADVKIDALAAAGTLTDADLVELFQPGETAGTRSRKLTLATLRALIGGVEVPIAVGDETSALVVGGNKVRFRFPFAFTLTGIFASVNDAPTGADLVVDLHVSGASVLSTKVTVPATTKDSSTGAAPVISSPAIAAFAECAVDVDQVGSTVAGAGLKVWLSGYRTP